MGKIVQAIFHFHLRQDPRQPLSPPPVKHEPQLELPPPFSHARCSVVSFSCLFFPRPLTKNPDGSTNKPTGTTTKTKHIRHDLHTD
eukprot:scaffold2519_cov168-Amphora_coffeaeformis.AAC.27